MWFVTSQKLIDTLSYLSPENNCSFFRYDSSWERKDLILNKKMAEVNQQAKGTSCALLSQEKQALSGMEASSG